MKNNALPITVGLSLALGLSACTRELTVPQANAHALKTFETQTLKWEACDPSLLPAPKFTKVLGKRMECADVQVPLDWNAPSRGAASFALMRVRAADPSARKGAIFLNPGGPGADGLLFGAVFGFLWNYADRDTRAGAGLYQLAQTYDLVGFSPRGVGQSSANTCTTNERFTPTHHPGTDRSAQNIDAMVRNSRLIARACQKSPLTPYVNTEQTARDLNLARALMGDAKLNYIGYSYGTWLGSWFAKMFPHQTGRMMLDGNTAFHQNFEEVFGLQPLGFERAFRETALGYAARHHDIFGLGATKEAVYAGYDRLPADLKFALENYHGESIVGALYSPEGITSIPSQLVAAHGVNEVLRANPAVKTAQAIAPLLAAHQFAQDADVQAAAQAYALPLADTYFSLLREEPRPISLDNMTSVFNSVVCNDTPSTQGADHWVKLGNEQATRYPLIGGSMTENVCAFWGAPTARKPETPSTMPPLLLVQNEYDPATVTEGALGALKATPGARMIFVDNETRHGSFPYDTECVDVQVSDYFLHGVLPAQAFNVCQAVPLPGEEQVYPVGQTYTSGLAPQAMNIRAATFGTAAATQEAQAILKQILERNALRY
ncbi:alpha/beta hydrolase [Deinococcus aquaedulcis]|uniref:alpha/beta hydrolase n=1 Tax=Deinococcus aquaedulcis TaxID=2840455 RepID=UPI001C83966D|nr:alpha/beta hydrolase [Deinococcus aquaedulcis]